MSIVQTVIGAIASSGSAPTPTYTLTPAANSVNEGSSLEFTVGGTNIADGNYYWTIADGSWAMADFSAINGTVSVTANSGTFTVTPTADDTTEGAETFNVTLRSISITGTILATSSSVTITDTSLTPVAPFSLQFRGGGDLDDYLRILGTQTDWNLGTTYTIEYWSKHDVGTDTVNATMNTVMSQANEPLAIDVGYIDGHLMFNAEPVNTPEPTPAVWTHVAFVREAGYGTITLYYNGVNVTTFDAGAALTFGPDDLYIGRRAWNDFQYFVGKLAMIRVSSTAKYLANFNPTVTYGVEADTKLMLGSNTPLVDTSASAHTITNTGVTQSTDFPVVPASITITNVSVDYNTRVATVDFTSTVSQSDFASVVFEWFGGAAFDGPFNLNVNPGSNIYTSPALSLAGSGNDLTTEISIATGSQACNSNIYTGSWSVVCLVEGTMITMADGSHKAVEDVRYNDLIRVWNFDLGEFSEALPVFVKREETHGEHNRFTFSDGTVLRTVGHHVFNKQAGAFTMLVRDTTPVGTITFNEQGEEVTLISKETIQEPVRFYNVWTQYHLNLFADSILTSNRFNNIYPIRDMKFVKDARALRPLEEFANIDPKYIAGLRLQEQPAQYSAEYIRDYVENKLERLDVNLVSTL
jgi:hypothetical protein